MSLLEAHAAMQGKRAAVIGGAFGIGRAITLALADAGVDIAICDNDAAALREVTPLVEGANRRVLPVLADACDAAALDGFYDQVEAGFGALDIVVNVVGGVKYRNFLETTREENADDIRRNYGYVVDSMRRAIPLIRKGGRGGSIVSFTTIEAHRGAAGYSVYAGAKAATTNFSRAMAVEFAAEGIRINIIAPDTTPARGTYSSGQPGLLGNEEFERYAGSAGPQLGVYIPQKKPPTPKDLANAVLFLVSDLSRTITGTVMHVDGGAMAAAGFISWPDSGFSPAPQGPMLERWLAQEPPAAG
jgi:NAD(P)-dependent dehydrogenase (short-subunit alcohol dehydrogenase family)